MLGKQFTKTKRKKNSKYFPRRKVPVNFQVLYSIEWDSSQWKWNQELQIWAEGEYATKFWGLHFLSGWGEGKMLMLVKIKDFTVSGTNCWVSAEMFVPCYLETESLQVAVCLQNSLFYFLNLDCIYIISEQISFEGFWSCKEHLEISLKVLLQITPIFSIMTYR